MSAASEALINTLLDLISRAPLKADLIAEALQIAYKAGYLDGKLAGVTEGTQHMVDVFNRRFPAPAPKVTP